MSEDTKVSKAQQKAVHRYVKANYDRLDLTIPKGQKEVIKAHASAHGESVNGFIGRAISETMERDGAGGPQETVGQPIGAGVVSLSSDTLEAAQRAAQSAGESVHQFIERAVETQARRDKGG